MRRWQAAKRQRQRRERPDVRQQRAAAAREQRALRREARQEAAEHPVPSAPSTAPVDTSAAWSRSDKIPGPICDRPGCYGPVRITPQRTARYCGDECCQAVRRVIDRERKFLRRNRPAGRFKRELEYESRRAWRRTGAAQRIDTGGAETPRAVLDSRNPETMTVICHAPPEVPSDDREVSADSQPRAPPT